MMIPMRISLIYGKLKVTFDWLNAVCLEFFSFEKLDCLEYMHKLLTEFSQANTVPLRLNHDSPLYKTFATSQVAQAHELPPSPVAWDKI